MKLLPVSKTTRALTLVEVLVVIGAVIVLVVLISATIATAKQKSRRATCVKNLKNVGLAFRLWGRDQTGDYVIRYSTNQGGTMEVVNEVWRSFQVMSNELGNPATLICPSDSRKAANSWLGLSNSNISYYIGMDAGEVTPNAILSGDWNLTNGQPLQNQVMTISSNTPVGWTAELHVGQGNIGLSDGSVFQTTNKSLQRPFNAALADFAEASANRYSRITNETVRLAMP